MVAGAVAMANVLGAPDEADPRSRIASALHEPDVHVHLYDKAPKRGRKLGHVTALAATHDDASRRARESARALTGGRP